MANDSLTILVVEDEELLLQAIVKKMEVTGVAAIACSSGQKAIEYLSSVQQMPDAIWLDYYLKDMNGLEFMDQLKQKPLWAAIPVVVVSNSASADKVSRMLALGVKKYLLKAETRLEDLIVIVRDLVRQNQNDQKNSGS